MNILKSLLLAALFSALTAPLFAQSTYKGLPLLKANSSKVNARIGSVHVNGLWTIKPEYNPNALHIQVNGQKEQMVLYTDIDSAVYELRPAKASYFYVLLNKEHYVYTEVMGFRKDGDQAKTKLLNIAKPQSKVFGSLWEKHHVGEVVEGINDYAEKASGAMDWVKSKLGSN
ncbi:hypothetical protein [Pontibacter ramchanderi]|uniref:DUF4468 domain-containing protein n=1 Tax=Pontibacter ramchanderi TaxID=1179743 RepID=A0A2N3U9X9_9BACT|nr:hypothetical protein [Pontibacter ramchanderi]PKV63545.1 hypothetical protein BD749_3389 [Pontibacter ramchanderi]